MADRRFVPGGGPAEQLAAVARDCERNNRKLGELKEMLDGLAAAVGQLAAQLAAPEQKRPPSWLDAGGPTAPGRVLDDLIGWLDRVYLRYPDAALPSCWLWHPWAVEELLWLRQAHHEAYDGPHASVARRADWHDRHRPGVARRMTERLGGCELLCHAEGGPAAHPPRRVPLPAAAELIAAWAADGLRTTGPVPTGEQLTEADRATRARQRH